MAWLKIDETLSDHPKVIRVAGALKLDKDTVAGKLIRLWTWALNNREHGIFAQQDSGTIAEVMRFKGKAARLVQALADAGLLDETDDGWKIHDWTDYAGSYVDKRVQANERKQKERQRKRDESVTPLLNKEEIPVDNCVKIGGQSRDIAVTSGGQQRDGSVTVTPLDIDIDIDKDKGYDYGGNRAGGRTCAREDSQEPGAPFEADIRDIRYSALIQTYEQNIRMPSAVEAESISKWLDDMPAKVIAFAIKQGALSGIRTWRGIETILTRWQGIGVKDLPGAQAAQRAWSNRGQGAQRPQGALGRTMSNLDALMAQTLVVEENGRNQEI